MNRPQPAIVFATLIVILTTLAPRARAQSLAEAAKKAEEARAAKKSDKKTDDKPTETVGTTKTSFTDKDLKDVSGLYPSATTAQQSATTETPASSPSAAAPAPAEQSETDRKADYRTAAKKDEAYWKARRAEAQGALDTDTIHLSAMIERVNSLSRDFNASQSVSQRLVLRQQREDAATEVTRLKAAVLTDTTTISRIEEEARRAGVPAGWLRP